MEQQHLVNTRVAEPVPSLAVPALEVVVLPSVDKTNTIRGNDVLSDVDGGMGDKQPGGHHILGGMGPQWERRFVPTQIVKLHRLGSEYSIDVHVFISKITSTNQIVRLFV